MSHQPISLQVNYEPMGVPYERPKSDKRSHAYIDLKAHPKQIKLVPEISDWPELEATIRLINSMPLFQTLGCAAWYFLREDTPETMRLRSYLNLGFTNAEYNKNVFSYYQFFGFALKIPFAS